MVGQKNNVGIKSSGLTASTSFATDFESPQKTESNLSYSTAPLTPSSWHVQKDEALQSVILSMLDKILYFNGEASRLLGMCSQSVFQE